ncbi:hypothetical protein [Homoserinimonas sp. A520]
MTVARRRGWWFAIGAASGGAVVATTVVIWTFVPVACTTVGYEDIAPIELSLPAGLSDNAEIAACFDMNCTMVVLKSDDAGNYAVPQKAPFLGPGETLPVSTTGVRVEVRDGGKVVADNRFGISTVSDAPFWSRCPAPFHYSPVTVGG